MSRLLALGLYVPYVSILWINIIIALGTIAYPNRCSSTSCRVGKLPRTSCKNEIFVGLIGCVGQENWNISLKRHFGDKFHVCCSGPKVCGQLCQRGGAISVLLKLLKEQPNSSSLTDVTELAVIALEKFADDSYGRQTLVKEQGVKYLVTVLKVESYQRTREVKSVATLILVCSSP